MSEELKSIVSKFKECDSQQYYLFFERDDEILNLDDFRYEQKDEEHVPQISVCFREGEYSGKQAFIINKYNSYVVYYKDKKIMDIEYDDFHSLQNFSNGNHQYIYFSYKGQQLNKIPDIFKCRYLGNDLGKSFIREREYFEITDIGEYDIYKNNKFYRKLITVHEWSYYIKDDEEKFIVSYI